MATTTPAADTAPTVPAPRNMPSGGKFTRYWRPESSDPSASVAKQKFCMPHDGDHNLIGGVLYQCFQCPSDGGTYAWVFPPATEPKPRYCEEHGLALTKIDLLETDRDPVAAARWRWFAERRATAARAAREKYEAAKAAGEEKAAGLYEDYRNHLPLLVAATGVFSADVLLVSLDQPWMTASLGVALATAGAVIAYVVVYLLERPHVAAAEEGGPRTKRANRAKEVARRAFYAAVAAGSWLTVASATGLDRTNPILAAILVLFAVVLAWATTHRQWDDITRRRDSQREAVRLAALAREKAAAEAAEAALREAEEAARLAAQDPEPEPDPEPAFDPENPIDVGKKMAQWWADTAVSEFAPTSFPAMRHTRIVAEKTEPVMVPIEDVVTRVGWQYEIYSKPGALVAPEGVVRPPIMNARNWLASMLGVSADRIEMIDQPDGQPNRATMIVLEAQYSALSATVPWRGAAGIRRERNGTISAFIGRDIKGNDVYEAIYVPRQLSGGLTVGNPGGGKTIGAIVKMLNLLVAGGLPILFDPKELVDYSDLVGLFPIGVTPEHLDVIMGWKQAERSRRQKLSAKRKKEARERVLARLRGEHVLDPEGEIPGAFNTDRDGLLVGNYWEEYHVHAKNNKFGAELAAELRMERAVAMFDHVITQGGGLQDLKDSVVRGILQQVSLEVYRMPLSQARLGGYDGTYNPEKLPRIPGTLLRVAEGAPLTPMRMAYISPNPDDEGNLFEVLLDANGEFKIGVADIPEPMAEVMRSEGLMDLWEMAKGPSGLDRLLAGTEAVVEHVTAEQAAGTVGQKVDAKFVILALLHEHPGSSRKFVKDHRIWQERAGWSGLPDPATISRAMQALTGHRGKERDQDLPVLVDKGLDEQTWTVTEAGRELAAQWAAELAGRKPAVTDADAGVSEGIDPVVVAAQEAELAEEMAAEARRLARDAYADSNA